MEAKNILLLNVSLILVISYSTDHWLLFKVRHIKSPTGCSTHNTGPAIYLTCTNSTHILVEQHTSLFWQCNDLTSGARRNATRHSLLYPEPCLWFLLSHSKWMPSAPWKKTVAALTATAAILTLLYGCYLCRRDHPHSVAKFLGLTMSLYGVTILMQLHIMHDINVEKATTEADSMRYCEAGWSMGSGAVGTALCGVCAYLFYQQSRIRRERLRSQRRRRQLHNAIMSSCRQEIALAIRAKMTVL